MGDRETKTAILAGAGTGKTTRIIELLVEALVERRMDPTRLLALTFTEKAANEMRDRLATKLEDDRASEPLALIDRMEVGTIHSFASHILRQFPVEAGVNPGFEVDEGAGAETLFRERWPGWLRENVPDYLDRVEPDALRAFARSLCEPGMPLSVQSSGEWKKLLDEESAFARELKEKYGDIDQKDNERRMTEIDLILRILGGNGDRRHADQLSGSRPRPLKKKGWEGWTDAEWGRFQELRLLARAALDTDDALMNRILTSLRPFVTEYRKEYTKRGFVSFNGLLVLAAELLRTNPEIRSHFKRRFRLILVDEFQDTDPLQGEILLFLAEKGTACAAHWQDVSVEPGKLIIVGDPKQSIYLFRGADLDAYRAVLRKVIDRGEESIEKLSVNYRSKRELVEFVNEACQANMKDPQYEPITPHGKRGDGGKVEAFVFEGKSADQARQEEGDAIADWILRERLRFGDVAILLRSLKNSNFYTEALRHRGIPYAIEGGKSFWQAPEVIDFVNLLTAIAHPTHEPSVVGLLRSPVGAVTDRELLHLRRAEAFCPLDIDRVPKTLGPVRRLYETLNELNQISRRQRIGELVRRTLERVPLREIWAASYRGEQAVANLEKLAWELSSVEARTIDAALSEARRRSRDREEEGESPLADEQLNAVRILSVHKSKGLEFPAVVFADLHRKRVGSSGHQESPILREWLSRKVGMRVGSVQNQQRYGLERERRQRQEQEEIRLLYVALTRARDRLLLTGGKASEDNFLGLLLPVPGLTILDRPVPQKPVEPASMLTEPAPEEEHQRWVEREAEARKLSRREEIRHPSTREEDRQRTGRWEQEEQETHARELGTLCHDILSRIDLAKPPKVKGEAGEILNLFFATDAFREIAGAEEVAREVPFVLEQDGGVWSGQIDVMYRKGKKWIVADYKTDRVEKPKQYRQQKEVYVEAVRRAMELKEAPEFRLIYLRSGKVIPI